LLKGVGECDWSPDGTKIAIGYGDGSGDTSDEAYGDGEVVVFNADGSGLTNLTSNSTGYFTPRWSPDGTKITFMGDRDGDQDMYTMDADGSDVAPVTTDSGPQVQDLDPDWQPLPVHKPPKDADGSDVAQGTKKPGVDDEDHDDLERTVIVKPGDDLWSISERRLGPEASPQRVYDHTYQVYALDRKIIGSDPDLIFAGRRLSLPPLGEGQDGGQHEQSIERTVPINPRQRREDCRQAEDSNAEIAFQDGGDIWTTSADSSGRTKHTNNSAAVIFPRWAPDGTKIIFASDRESDFDIYTMDVDGSDIAQVKNAR
jgi:dipeptidyl aminopeptidase/acylaminoacyl peptidase